MRAFAAVFLLAAVAGCASPAQDLPTDQVDATVAPLEPVAIHDVVPLVQGAQRTWSFDVGANATQVDIRFFATGKAVAGAGLPACVRWESPTGSDAAGVCQGGQGNILIAPFVVMPEGRTFLALGKDAAVGSYVVALDAQPSAVDFHAVVTVTYA